MGTEVFRLFSYGEPIELLPDHKHWNHGEYGAHWHTNEACCRQTFDSTDFLSENSIAKPDPIAIYDEEYVIDCVIPLLDFIKIHGSITDEKPKTTQMDQTKDSHATKNQSETRHVQISRTVDNNHCDCSSLIKNQNSDDNSNQEINLKYKKVDLKIVESIEREASSVETL